MAEALTNSLRDLMARQHVRGQIAALMQEYGDDFVIFIAQDIAKEKRRKAMDAYVKERDSARAAFSSPSQAGAKRRVRNEHREDEAGARSNPTARG